MSYLYVTATHLKIGVSVDFIYVCAITIFTTICRDLTAWQVTRITAQTLVASLLKHWLIEYYHFCATTKYSVGNRKGQAINHDGVMRCKPSPYCWSFVREPTGRSPVDSLKTGQYCGALIFSSWKYNKYGKNYCNMCLCWAVLCNVLDYTGETNELNTSWLHEIILWWGQAGIFTDHLTFQITIAIEYSVRSWFIFLKIELLNRNNCFSDTFWFQDPFNCELDMKGMYHIGLIYRQYTESTCIIAIWKVYDIDGLVQERRKPIANALGLRLSCTNLLICNYIAVEEHHCHSFYVYCIVSLYTAESC